MADRIMHKMKAKFIIPLFLLLTLLMINVVDADTQTYVIWQMKTMHIGVWGGCTKIERDYSITWNPENTTVSRAQIHVAMYCASGRITGKTWINDVYLEDAFLDLGPQNVGDDYSGSVALSILKNGVNHFKFKACKKPFNYWDINIYVYLNITLTYEAKAPTSEGGETTTTEFGEEPEKNLMNLHYYFGKRLGIPPIAAGLIFSALFLMMVLLPLNILVRKSGWLNIAVGFIVMGFLVAITWMPLYVMLIIVLLIIGLYGYKISEKLR